MDVFKLDQSLAAGLGGAPSADKLTADVSFGAGTTDEFNLSFFDDTTTDTAGSESHDPPPQGFGDESCTAMDSAASSPAAAFHDVRVQSPSSSCAYRQSAYVHAAPQPLPPPPPAVAINLSTTSSSSSAIAPAGQSPRENLLDKFRTHNTHVVHELGTEL